MQAEISTQNFHGSQHAPLEDGGEDYAQVGVIEKVTVQNFLCHRFLEIAFGLNVNFVNGANGSKL